MRVDVITLFPSVFDAPMSASIPGIARQKGLLDLTVHDLRDWTHDVHRTVDDEPFGGGPGMVMKPEPLYDAVTAVREQGPHTPHVIFLTPSGRPFDQQHAERLATQDSLLLVCGRYEGFDERSYELADELLSIGDYVVSGGEIPAMLVIDAVVRLIPGVLGNESSTQEESFGEGLLEYPQYTRPAEFMGSTVPEVLRSGNHAAIATWRREQALRRTAKVRPDLLDRADLSRDEMKIVREQAERNGDSSD